MMKDLRLKSEFYLFTVPFRKIRKIALYEKLMGKILLNVTLKIFCVVSPFQRLKSRFNSDLCLRPYIGQVSTMYETIFKLISVNT